MRRNERTAMEKDSSNLPCEIIFFDILSRLPVKSLFRFKSVCKSWKSVISDDRQFTRQQHERSKLNPSRQALLLGRDQSRATLGSYGIVRSTDDLKTHMDNLYFSAKQLHGGVLVCSCEGLVLVVDKRYDPNKTACLWNPSVRKYTIIPCPDGTPFSMTFAYGLCYDSSTDDYKVVMIGLKSYTVFSLKNGSWGQRKAFDYSGISQTPSVFVNGAVHWVVTRSRIRNNNHPDGFGWYLGLNRYYFENHWTGTNGPKSFEEDKNYAHEIISFDPKEEKFEILLRRPEPLDETNVFYLTALRGLLGLYCFNKSMSKITIWLWKNYGDYCDKINKSWAWAEFITIDIDVPWPVNYFCNQIIPLLVTEDMKMVVQINGIEVLIYDMKKLDAAGRCQMISGCVNGRNYWYGVSFLESLYLPGVSDKPKKRRWLSSTRKENKQK